MTVRKWVLMGFSVLTVVQFSMGQIAITEFLNDPLGDDGDSGREYVELFNYSDADIDVQNWVIKDEDTNNLIVSSTSKIVPSGGFLLFASGKSVIEAEWFNGVADDRIIEYGGPNSETMELSNSSDELLLLNASGDTSWVLAWSNDDVWDTTGAGGDDGYSTYLDYQIDFTTYPSRWGNKALPRIVRNGFDNVGHTINDTTATGADTTYVDSVLGYEGGAFYKDYFARLSLNGDSGSPLAGWYAQVSGKQRSDAKIAITEFMNDPTDADTDMGREYVELFNYGLVDVNVQNWTIKDEDHDILGGDFLVLTTDPIIIPSGGYLLWASGKSVIENEYFGGVADDRIIEYGGPSALNMQLSNSSDELVLMDASGDTTWNLAYINDDAWDGSTDDAYATYLEYATDFSTGITNWGHKDQGIVRNGPDTLVAGAPLGYEMGAFTLDEYFIASLGGDMGSPLRGSYQVIPVSIDAEDILPEALSLNQNYPNPFNPTTTIRFSLQIQSDAQMVIFDITGRTIKTVEMPSMSAGQHEYIWDGRNAQGQIVSTGVYFCRLQTTGYNTGAIKMIYLK